MKISKFITASIIIISVVTVIWLQPNAAEPSPTDNMVVAMNLDSCKALINSEKVMINPKNIDIRPYLIKGSTYIPLDFMARNFGYETTWNRKTKIMIIKSETDTLQLKEGSTIATLNGKKQSIKYPMTTLYQTPYISLRVFSKLLQKNMYYSNDLIVVSDKPLKLSNEEVDNMTIKILSINLPEDIKDFFRNSIVGCINNKMLFINNEKREGYIGPTGGIAVNGWVDYLGEPKIIDNKVYASINYINYCLKTSMDINMIKKELIIQDKQQYYSVKLLNYDKERDIINSSLATMRSFVQPEENQEIKMLDIDIKLVNDAAYIDLEKITRILGKEYYYNDGIFVLSDEKMDDTRINSSVINKIKKELSTNNLVDGKIGDTKCVPLSLLPASTERMYGKPFEYSQIAVKIKKVSFFTYNKNYKGQYKQLFDKASNMSYYKSIMKNKNIVCIEAEFINQTPYFMQLSSDSLRYAYYGPNTINKNIKYGYSYTNTDIEREAKGKMGDSDIVKPGTSKCITYFWTYEGKWPFSTVEVTPYCMPYDPVARKTFMNYNDREQKLIIDLEK